MNPRLRVFLTSVVFSLGAIAIFLTRITPSHRFLVIPYIPWISDREDLQTISGPRVRSIDWEKLTWDLPPLGNWTMASSPQNSTISYVGKVNTIEFKDSEVTIRTRTSHPNVNSFDVYVKAQPKKVSGSVLNGALTVGEEVIVNITVKDFNGRRRRIGGDIVRVVAKDATQKAASKGYVVDHNDGTYTGVVKLFWAGNVTIEAMVGPTREMTRIMYRAVNSGQNKRPFYGRFGRNAKVNCTPIVELARHYKSVCDLSSYNADLPWFCEKPINGSCDTNRVRFSFDVRPVKVTREEESLLQRLVSQEVPDRLTLLAQSGSNDTNIWRPPDLPSCHTFPARVTWTLRSPVGFLHRDVWHPLHCRSTFRVTPTSLKQCLGERQVLFLGDSNIRETMEYIQREAKQPLRMLLKMHAMPRYINLKMTKQIKGTHGHIDEIPANSTDIVIVHFYLHFNPFPPSIVRQHIRKTVQSVKALHGRAQNTKVIVRGCHSLFLLDDKVNFSLVWAMVYDIILKEEFAEIVDFVYFWDMWDITEAMGNMEKHPPESILKHGVQYLLSLICPPTPP